MLLSLVVCSLAVSALALDGPSAKAPPKGKWFQRVFTVIFENEDEVDVIRNHVFGAMGKKGVELLNYYAITHPSQPNYISMTSGDTYISDDSPHNIDAKNIVDLLEAKGLTWKSYQEDWPGPCYAGAVEGKYYRKHNPFISFNNIRTDSTRCANIVDSQQLYTDIAKNQLPNYMFFTPNIDNDGHNTGIDFAGKWLDQFLTPLLGNSTFMDGTMIVITWDEDDRLHGNHIYTALIGAGVTAGTVDNTKYTHYSLLRTIEDNWGLGTLTKNDAAAVPFKCMK